MSLLHSRKFGKEAHKDTVEHPDREECTKDFGNFLKKQGHVVDQVRKKGDTTKNFGLKFFIS